MKTSSSHPVFFNWTPWARWKISGRCRYRNNSSSIHIQQTYTHSTNTYKVTSMLTNIYAPIDSLSFVNRRDSYLCIPGKFSFSISKCFSYPSRETSSPLGLSLLTIEVFGDSQRKCPLTLGLENILFSVPTRIHGAPLFLIAGLTACWHVLSFLQEQVMSFNELNSCCPQFASLWSGLSHTRIDNYPAKSRCLSSVIPAHLGQLGIAP